MNRLEFHPMGDNPEIEALRLRSLYRDDGVDQKIRSEFKYIVDTYSTLNLDKLRDRITARYSGSNPVVCGTVAVLGSIDIGTAFWGPKDFISEKRRDYVNGLNVSAWILQNYRGMGYGNELYSYASKLAASQEISQGLTIWTSVAIGNKASEKMVQNAGFILEGAQTSEPGRQVFILNSSNAD